MHADRHTGAWLGSSSPSRIGIEGYEMVSEHQWTVSEVHCALIMTSAHSELVDREDDVSDTIIV